MTRAGGGGLHKISVLLAVHNGARFIAQAIDSIRAQTYGNWELLCVSNGSTDDTLRICREHAAAEPRVRVFELAAKNKNAAYNYAYRQSSGDYVCFFAADDLLPRDSLERRVWSIAGREAESYGTCCLKTVSEISRFDGLVFPRNRHKPNYSGGSLLFSRLLADRIFPIPEELPNEDTWASLHLRAFGSNHHIAEPLYWYRIHEANSFGYGIDFEMKRQGFLKRMRAYQLFHDAHRDTGLSMLETEVAPFLRALQAVSERRIAGIVAVPRLGLRSKLVLLLYSSAVLYNIRNRYFRALSGIAQ